MPQIPHLAPQLPAPPIAKVMVARSRLGNAALEWLALGQICRLILVTSAGGSGHYSGITHDVRNDFVWDQGTVSVPVFVSILLSAGLVVSNLPVQKEDDEKAQVPVGDGRVEPGGQRPREAIFVSNTKTDGASVTCAMSQSPR